MLFIIIKSDDELFKGFHLKEKVYLFAILITYLICINN